MEWESGILAESSLSIAAVFYDMNIMLMCTFPSRIWGWSLRPCSGSIICDMTLSKLHPQFLRLNFFYCRNSVVFWNLSSSYTLCSCDLSKFCFWPFLVLANECLHWQWWSHVNRGFWSPSPNSPQILILVQSMSSIKIFYIWISLKIGGSKNIKSRYLKTPSPSCAGYGGCHMYF